MRPGRSFSGQELRICCRHAVVYSRPVLKRGYSGDLLCGEGYKKSGKTTTTTTSQIPRLTITSQKRPSFCHISFFVLHIPAIDCIFLVWRKLIPSCMFQQPVLTNHTLKTSLHYPRRHLSLVSYYISTRSITTTLQTGGSYGFRKHGIFSTSSHCHVAAVTHGRGGRSPPILTSNCICTSLAMQRIVVYPLTLSLCSRLLYFTRLLSLPILPIATSVSHQQRLAITSSCRFLGQSLIRLRNLASTPCLRCIHSLSNHSPSSCLLVETCYFGFILYTQQHARNISAVVRSEPLLS